MENLVGVRKVPLRKLWRPSGEFALVDAEDFHLVCHLKWRIHSDGYAITSQLGQPQTKRTNIYMHRLIIKPGKGLQADHINGNRLDNRRCNLRVATSSQNNSNNSRRRIGLTGYRGVSWCRHREKYVARVQHKNKEFFLGSYSDPKSAHAAYVRMAKKLHQEFYNPGTK
jgi:hypothetical protein